MMQHAKKFYCDFKIVNNGRGYVIRWSDSGCLVKREVLVSMLAGVEYRTTYFAAPLGQSTTFDTVPEEGRQPAGISTARGPHTIDTESRRRRATGVVVYKHPSEVQDSAGLPRWEAFLLVQP